LVIARKENYQEKESFKSTIRVNENRPYFEVRNVKGNLN
jgi:hypothetical protein